MALKSWQIKNFPGATIEDPVTLTLVETPPNKVIITLSMIVSNSSSSDDANIVVRRMLGATEKFKWYLTIPQGNSPFSLDSKIVLQEGESLSVGSDNPDVGIDVSGSEDAA